MMNHYTIISEEPNRMRLHLEEQHDVYRGHFPERAVCPGVMTIGMVRDSVAHQLQRELRWKHINSCRFTGMLYPGDNVELTWTATTDDEGQIVIKAEMKKNCHGADDEKVLTLSASLQ